MKQFFLKLRARFSSRAKESLEAQRVLEKQEAAKEAIFHLRIAAKLKEAERMKLLTSKGLTASKLMELDLGVKNLQFMFDPKTLIQLGFKKEDFLAKDCAFQAKNYHGAGLTARYLAKTLGFTREELKRLNFPEQEIVEAFVINLS